MLSDAAYLFDASWLFLAVWCLTVVTIFVMVFGHDIVATYTASPDLSSKRR